MRLLGRAAAIALFVALTVSAADACAPLTITGQPQNTTITAGQSATLTISVSGDSPSYQWYRSEPSGSVPVGTNSSSLTVSPTQTTTYFVWVYDACGTAAISDAVTVTVNQASCVAPAITSHPQSATVTIGQPHTLSVTASGTGPFTYQWYRAGGNASTPIGTNSSSLTITPEDSERQYFVWVYNSCGSAISNAATIRTTSGCTSPTILSDPQSTQIQAGQSATVSVTVGGTAPFAYQWYEVNPNGSIPVGTNSSTLTVSPPSTTSYFVWIYNACGRVASPSATVSVGGQCVPPTITDQPDSTSIVIGESATLSAAAGGTGPFRYDWYELRPNGAVLVASNTASVTVSPRATTDYYVYVTASCGVVGSAAARVDVQSTAPCNAPYIVAQPQSATVQSGTPKTISVTPGGTGPFTYQWYEANANGSIPVGTNSSSLTVTLTSTKSYFVWIHGACGSVASSLVTLTVPPNSCFPASFTSNPTSRTITQGQSTTLTVAVDGTQPVISWYEINPNGSIPVGTNATSLTVSPNATKHYYAVVTNECGTAASTIASVEVTGGTCVAPSIDAQPYPRTIDYGQSATLHVFPSGTSPFTYSWFQVGSGGEISPSRSLTVTPTTTTSYRVRVTNACGTITSDTVTVTIRDGSCLSPSIQSHPQSTTIQPGQSTTLTASAMGSGTLRYEWYRDEPSGPIIVQYGGTSLTVSPSSTKTYFVRVWGPCPGGTTVQSASATVTVAGVTTPPGCTNPTITQQPQSSNGYTTTVSVTAAGAGPFTYQWYRSGQSGTWWEPMGTNSPTFTTGYCTKVYVHVSDPCGEVTSHIAYVDHPEPGYYCN